MEIEDCGHCKYAELSINDDPCNICIYGTCHGTECMFEDKDLHCCETCRHQHNSWYEDPCAVCNICRQPIMRDMYEKEV